MNFYTQQHRYYCGIDLHAKRMYLCILNSAGEIVHHQNGDATPHGKAKALSILAHKLGRAVYFMLKRQQPFDLKKFCSA